MTTNRTYYYARVSSDGQNLDRQIAAFEKLPEFNEAYLITDKASGKSFDRPGWEHLKVNCLRDGDTLVVKEIDRLGRDKQGVLDELNWMRQHHIRVKILDLPTSMIELGDEMRGQAWAVDMVNSLLIEVYTSLAQQELEHRAQRQREGISSMKTDEKGRKISSRTGRVMGRPEKDLPANWDAVIERWRRGEITAVQAAKEVGLGRTCFYRHLKEQGLAK